VCLGAYELGRLLSRAPGGAGSLLIRGGLVVTMNPRREIMSADIYVEDGRIAEIPSRHTAADLVIDATGQLVLPGLIQTHVHLCQTLFRGSADDLDVVEWLRQRIWPLEQVHDFTSVYDSARLGIVELLRGGTTTALTIETVRHTEAVFMALAETGLRAVTGKAMMDRLEVATEMIGETTEESLRESLALAKEYHQSSGGRLGYAFCPRGPRNCTEELWDSVIAAAMELGTIVHTHAAENFLQSQRLKTDGGTDIRYLHGLGATAGRLVVAHAVWVDEEEIALLADSGTAVAHCPSANMKLASGFAPVPEMRDRGVIVGLGADGAPCNNTLDAFHEMRMAALIHKPRLGAQVMSAQEVLEMATIDGARSLGLELEIGSLEAGKRADIILLNREGSHLWPQSNVDPIVQVVYQHRASDVSTVLVDGRVLLADGELTELDADEIHARAEESARRVFARVAASGALR